MVNPYSNNIYTVSLKREDVDGFVFWTKNIGSFMNKLEIIHQRGYPFIVQYTIHSYPRDLEGSVIDADRSIKYMELLADFYGPKVAIWRYDPIIFTSITPSEFHLQNFESLAKRLEGITDEVVISFAQIYKKTFANMEIASKNLGFTWSDPEDKIKYNLASKLAEIAKAHNIQLTMCSQKRFLAPGVKEARCVDARRLSEIAGYPIRAKLKGNRPECGCYQSIDIGAYDTCPHGCFYCYAVRDRNIARKNYKKHDREGDFICQPNDYINSDEMKLNKDKSKQMLLP